MEKEVGFLRDMVNFLLPLVPKEKRMLGASDAFMAQPRLQSLLNGGPVTARRTSSEVESQEPPASDAEAEFTPSSGSHPPQTPRPRESPMHLDAACLMEGTPTPTQRRVQTVNDPMLAKTHAEIVQMVNERREAEMVLMEWEVAITSHQAEAEFAAREADRTTPALQLREILNLTPSTVHSQRTEGEQHGSPLHINANCLSKELAGRWSQTHRRGAAV